MLSLGILAILGGRDVDVATLVSNAIYGHVVTESICPSDAEPLGCGPGDSIRTKREPRVSEAIYEPGYGFFDVVVES